MNKEELKVYMKKYRQEHKKENNEAQKRWRKLNKEKALEYQKKYNNTPMGRALYLVNAYNQKDKIYNRGQGDLTAKWIVENIFTQPCVHCGETDWHKIGCNRIDNSLPHTIDNVEPCCYKCNVRLPKKNLQN